MLAWTGKFQSWTPAPMGGGCEAYGMVDVILKQGSKTLIRGWVHEVGAILTTTDHAAGHNRYYSPAKK